MWPFYSLVVGYCVIFLVQDVGAKICSQNQGHNVVMYMQCYGECCGDWYYRYCCASGTINLYAICAGVTLLGVMILLILAMCCRYRKRRARQMASENNPGDRNAIPPVAQPALFSEPPVYSVHDTLQGYANTAFQADVVTQYEYMKPPEYQKDPPPYEKDPPAYSNTVKADETDNVAECSPSNVGETGHSSSEDNVVASAPGNVSSASGNVSSASGNVSSPSSNTDYTDMGGWPLLSTPGAGGLSRCQ